MKSANFFVIFVLILGLFSCHVSEKAVSKKLNSYELPALSKVDFNKFAAQQSSDAFWVEDKNSNGRIDPSELEHVDKSPYVSDGKFTPSFNRLYGRIAQKKRRAIVEKELAQGRSTEILTDFTDKNFSSADRKFVRHIANAAKLIEELYQIQRGSFQYKDEIFKSRNKNDHKLYTRNQGPWCEAPETKDSPFCNALSYFPEQKFDIYPTDLKHDESMCKEFAAIDASEENKENKLLGHFNVVRKQEGKYVAVPYTEAYRERMKEISDELLAASQVYTEKKEKALNEYLVAASRSFLTNLWENADQKWIRMNTENSKWFLRIGPDETYFEPCQVKAGFQLMFGLVNQDSKKWKDRLEKLKQEMEKDYAALIGRSYRARKITFKTPEFAEIIIDAGEARHGLGAVSGTSLPNWGQASKNRRTIVFTNFYTDPVSMEVSKKKASLVFTQNVLDNFNPGRDASSLNTIVHEATHNLGPDSAHKVRGKSPRDLFTNLTSVLEEFKAQTGAIWYLKYLHKKGYLTDKELTEQYIANIYWGCINNMSRGLFTTTGIPKAHNQTGAIQFGKFIADGAIKQVKVDDSFRLDIDFDKLHNSSEALMKTVGQIKAKGSSKWADRFVSHYITGKGYKKDIMDEITKRYRSYPKESFFYSVKLN